MKRYRLVIDFRGEYDGMEEDPNGSYVHHEDAMAAIAAEREACAQLVEEDSLPTRQQLRDIAGDGLLPPSRLADAIRKRGAL